MKTKKLLVSSLALALVLGGVAVSGSSVLQGRFQIPSLSVAKPDLTISDIYVDEDGKLSIKQENIGKKDAGSTGYSTVYINGTLEWTYNWGTLTDTNFRLAGGNSILQPQTLEGVNTVKACIDAMYNITEKDETNNCLEVEVGPDLVIDTLAHSPNPATDADQITFSGLVWNDGNAPSEASVLEYFVGGNTYPELISIPSLQVGSSLGYTFEIVLEAGDLTAQNYQNDGRVDVDNEVDELDETNNEYLYRYTVSPE